MKTRTMNRKLVVAAITLSFMLFANFAIAHHGTGISYDSSKTITMKGTVTEFRYANPHLQLFCDSKDEKRNVQHWTGEIASNRVLWSA